MTVQKLSKGQQVANNGMVTAMQRLERDMHNRITRDGGVPGARREVW